MPTGYDTANTRKIGYVMLGDTDKVLASTRITILNTLDLVRENGYKPKYSNTIDIKNANKGIK